MDGDVTVETVGGNNYLIHDIWIADQPQGAIRLGHILKLKELVGKSK
jgi:hypothetical protein